MKTLIEKSAKLAAGITPQGIAITVGATLLLLAVEDIAEKNDMPTLKKVAHVAGYLV